jgi:hypothetical protein
MAELREPRLGVAVGRKGCGKTYTTTKMIEKYVVGNPSKGVAPRRVLILDVNDEFEQINALRLSDVIRFSAHPKIEARRIRPFNDNGVRWTIREIQDALFRILNDFRGGLLLIEDINRYVSDTLPNDLIGAICTNRHTDTDIILHFQSIGRISPKIWQNLNWIRFHKITDDVTKHQNKYAEKFELLLLVEAYVNKEYYAGNKRIFVYVDVDDEKVIVPDKSKFEKVIQDYLILNQKKYLDPLTKKNPLIKEKPLTLEQALTKKTQELINQYVM